MAHPAQLYNEVKDKTFAILHRDGKDMAYRYLYGQKNVMPITAWYGLKAELDFFTGYQRKFGLTPTLDYGIKCDFAGMMDGGMCRIDVTTNIGFKDFKTYDTLQQTSGIPYKIVVMDKTTGKMEDVFDLNFVPDGYGGKLFDVALFMPMDYNSHGDPKYNPYQRIVTISSTTKEIVCEKGLVTDWYLPDIHTKLEEIYEAYQDLDDNGAKEKIELDKYLAEAAKILSKSSELNIVACGQTNNEIVNPRTCETEEITRLYWKHPMIIDYIKGDVVDE